MPIKRCSDQNPISLEAFYQGLIDTSTNHYKEVGKRMIDIVKVINQTFKETMLWGLTSHARLVIQSEDSWESAWYVIISSIGMEEYYIEYLMPEDKSPWKNAMVRAQAQNLEEAKRLLIIAMNESEEWKGNKELEALVKSAYK